MKRLIAYTLVTCGILTAQQSRKDERPEATGLEKLCADLSAVMSTAVWSLVKQQAAEDIMALSRHWYNHVGRFAGTQVWAAAEVPPEEGCGPGQADCSAPAVDCGAAPIASCADNLSA